jgi:hypothetical protein
LVFSTISHRRTSAIVSRRASRAIRRGSFRGSTPTFSYCSHAIKCRGIGAPKDTPANIVSKLNNEITAGLADPKIKERLADLGGEAKPMTPAEFGKLITDETEKWAKVIRAANIKLK